MRKTRFLAGGFIVWAAMSTFADPSSAQAGKDAQKSAETAPTLHGVFPPGARRGETLRWMVAGKGLADVEQCVFSGDGVEGKIIGKPADDKAELEISVKDSAEAGYREFRLAGPTGITNLMIVRIDHLAQNPEEEPNDSLSDAQSVAIDSAVCATLKPAEADCFRVTGQKGRALTIDLEARRLGVPLTPLITIFAADGRELEQGRETPGLSGDCRMIFVFPENGDYVIQIRDQIYSGGESAHYRLRLNSHPIATGLFPLGGPKGGTIEVIADGGGLAPGSVKKTIALSDRPGERIDPGPFDGPGGPMTTPFVLAVGDGGPEVFEGENIQGNQSEPALIPLGGVANGRLDRPGEFDRYRVEVKKGQPIRLRILAGALGSWLDSVLILRDEQGRILADNDEPDPNELPGSGLLSPDNPRARDSRLDYEPKADGVLTVEVYDRFRAGGPEYGYRLEYRKPSPELAIVLLLRSLLANARVQGGSLANQPGADGSLNLRPGSKTPINFQVSAIDFQGKVEVRVEGLPPGVTVAPVTVRLTARGGNRSRQRLRSDADRLVFSVAKDAEPSLSRIRIVAIAKPVDEAPIEQVAIIPLTLDSIKMSTPARPVVREARSLPLMVLEGAKP